MIKPVVFAYSKAFNFTKKYIRTASDDLHPRFLIKGFDELRYLVRLVDSSGDRQNSFKPKGYLNPVNGQLLPLF